MPMTPETKQEIVNALQQRGAVLPCPRCGNNNFTLLDGYFNQAIQESLNNIVIGGAAVPSVIVACNKCGYMSQHALGVLGLMPSQGEQHGTE